MIKKQLHSKLMFHGELNIKWPNILLILRQKVNCMHGTIDTPLTDLIFKYFTVYNLIFHILSSQ